MARVYQPADMSEYYASNEPKQSGRVTPEKLKEFQARRAAEEEAARQKAIAERSPSALRKAQATGVYTSGQRRALAARRGAPLPPEEPVPPEGPLETTTSEEPEVAESGAATRADAAPAGGEGLTSGVDSVIYRLRKVQEAIKTSTGEQKEALEAHAETLKAQAQEVAAREQEMTERADRRVRGMELMAQRQEEAESRATAEIRNAERMVTSHEIDPNRAFKTTGARVGSAIAIAMSALGQGMSGRAGPNTAYKIINDAINRDIDLQKEELRTRKDVMRNKNNLYANMMAKFGNERSAELATAKAGMTAAVQSLQALKATHKSQNAQLVIDEQITKIEAEGQKKVAELLKVEGNAAIAKMNAQARAGVRGGRGKEGAAKTIQSALAKLDKLPEKFKRVGPIEGIAATIFSGLGLGGMLFALPGARDAEYYEDARNLIAKEITRAYDGGRPTDKDFAILLARLPPAGEDKERGLGKIENLRSFLEAEAIDGRFDSGALEAKYGKKLTADQIAAGRAMGALADKENWFEEGR